MSLIGRVVRESADLGRRRADPWAEKLRRNLGGVDAMSSTALLDLLGLPTTTGNGRRLAQTMRSMGWVGLKSRRLMPGGFRGTTIRGWARPLLGKKSTATSTDRSVGAKTVGG